MLFILSCVGASSCFSTGDIISDETIRISRTVRPPEGVVPYLEPFVGPAASVLTSYGFKMSDESSDNASQLRMDFNPNAFNMTVRISLWNDGRQLVSASAKNLGFGTILGRSAAVGNLANSAIERFEKELAQIKGHIKFIPDPPKLAGQADRAKSTTGSR